MSSLTDYNLTNRLFVALIHLWAQDFRLTDIFKSQFVAFEIAWNYITGLSRPWWLRKLLHFWGQLRQHSRTEIGIEQNWSFCFILDVLIEHYWYNLSILPCPVSKRLISARCKPTINNNNNNNYVSLPDHYEIHTFISFTRFYQNYIFGNSFFCLCESSLILDVII